MWRPRHGVHGTPGRTSVLQGAASGPGSSRAAAIGCNLIAGEISLRGNAN